jgi:hypothetical protein
VNPRLTRAHGYGFFEKADKPGSTGRLNIFVSVKDIDMKCFVPFVKELSLASVRFLRIAQSLGADCVPVRLPRGSANPVGDLESAVTEKAACVVICPAVMRAWLETDQIPISLATYLVKRFKFLLVHELDTDPISTNVLRALSEEALYCVRRQENTIGDYQVASEELCGAFSGLNFGPANPADRILGVKSDQKCFDPIVSIGGEPLFGRIRMSSAEMFFLASTGATDLESDVSGRPLAEYFSQLLPVAMFLRHAFQAECWRPAGVPHATLTVDDPPLWERYGFVNYERLLALMDEFSFHTTIAFIPYYWHKSSPATIRLFRQRPDRLSICFHGNDHTGGEFATQNVRRLDYMLRTAQTRMQSHQDLTGISCDNVMVFPHCRFSRNAIRALKEHNFYGYASSRHSPEEERTPLTMLEMTQPSILTCNAFPLFLRRPVRDFQPENVAFNAFFGRPILIEEHHEIFKDPSLIVELVSMINKTVPQVQWCNLQTSLMDTCLIRQAADSTLEVRPAAMAGRITNPGSSRLRCVADWITPTQFCQSGASVLIDNNPSFDSAWDDVGVRVSFEVAPGASRVVAMRYNNAIDSSLLPKPSFKQRSRVYLRRRASELRDNVLSKSPAVLSFANSVVRLARRFERQTIGGRQDLAAAKFVGVKEL